MIIGDHHWEIVVLNGKKERESLKEKIVAKRDQQREKKLTTEEKDEPVWKAQLKWEVTNWNDINSHDSVIFSDSI